jgi:archaellum component FlaC
MEIVIDAHIIWNVLLTFILTPLGFLVRNIMTEQSRLAILINRTREEVAKDYVTRDQIEKDFQRMIDTIDRIDEKIDRLQSKTYFQE